MNSVELHVERRRQEHELHAMEQWQGFYPCPEPTREQLAEWRREAFRCPGPACDLVGTCS